LFPSKLYVTEKRKYVKKGYILEISYLPTVLLSMPFNKLP
jgi:hypothetical protein